MARTVPVDREAFLASLRAREEHHRAKDHAYEAMMYRARAPPTQATLTDIVRFTRHERPEDIGPPVAPTSRETMTTLARIAEKMRWPDPTPLRETALALPAWDTLHVTTFLHTMIPDYPIWGPSESKGLERLGIDIPYDADPNTATIAYGAYIAETKRIRDEARVEHVPESHHYLTRIVQTALQDLGET